MPEEPISTLELAEFSAALQPGLRLLGQAQNYARHLSRSLWDFAVESEALLQAGLNLSDLRWLVCAGLVEHGRDVTEPGASPRVFRREEGLVFGPNTCFVLTPAGEQHVRFPAAPGELEQVLTGASRFSTYPITATDLSIAQNHSSAPKWDQDRHQLHFGGFLVKEFKLNSPNQETILTAFEEENWPPRIDDPLLHRADVDPKERLRNTIKSLNRNQVNQLLRFMGDGTGQAIRWESISKRTRTRGAARA